MARRVRALPDGTVRVELPAPERDLLRSLPEQLRPIITGEDDPVGAHGRLFPSAYEDPEDEADYRELIGADLAEERLAALEAFAETLDAGRPRLRGWQVDLDAEQAESWVSATNDARLVLAMVVGIESEDEWERGPAPGDAAGVALWYLGWLQEELLAALAEGPSEPGPSEP